jgi:hypothetical protein
MASTLALGAWPGPSGLDPVAYYTEFLEQFQFHLPTGVIPSRLDDILGAYTNELQVFADSTGMQVKVYQGRCQIKGVFGKVKDADVSGGVYTLGPFTNADASNPRIDRVVLRANLSTGAITLQILAGTAAATPQPAALTQTNTSWDLPLAQINIPAASSTIAPYQVMDERIYAATPAALADALSIPNPIVNGGMGIWNEATTFTSIATGTYAAEQFVYSKSGTGVHDVLQAVDVPTAGLTVGIESYSSHLDVTTADVSIAAGDLYIYETKIEGRRIKPLLSRGFTLPFWVKAAKVGYHAVSFVNSGGDRSCVCEYFVETADTWLLKWVRVPPAPSAGTWDYLSGIGLRVVWCLAAGSTYQYATTQAPGTWQTGTFYATSRQVNELDSTANNFKLAMVGRMTAGGLILPFAPHPNEEVLSKRYYNVLKPGTANAPMGQGVVASSTVVVAGFAFPEMRATPVGSISAAGDFSAYDGAVSATGTTVSVASAGNGSAQLSVTASGGGLSAGRGCIILAANTNAAIKLNARL